MGTNRAEFDPEESTVSGIRAGIESGETTARDLVEWHLDRIERFDEDLQAFITVSERARERAADLDRRYEHSGFQGPLHGVPVVLKDNVDTTDMRTTAGTPALADHRPDSDAVIVDRIRDAGGIVLGKTNLHELARAGTTVSTVGGQTRNPYDRDRTPGGSSGGTGAAVAANLGVVGIGTDTINSIRSPASACNLVGLRPTQGLVSRTGIVPSARTQDSAGPIARTVEDAAILLSVIAGYDPGDPVTARGVGYATDFAAQLEGDLLGEARIGVLRSVFGEGPDFDPVTAVVEAAIDEIREAGATVVEIEPDTVRFDVDSLIDRIDVQKWEGQSDFDEYLDGHPEAPVESFQALVERGPIHETIVENLLAAYGIEDPREYSHYLRRLARADDLRRRLFTVFARDDLDALVFPHQKRPVVEIGESQLDRNGFLASGSGFPAIVVPAGFTGEDVPVGIEFLGRPFEDSRLLSLARDFEARTTHRRPPPGFR
ncbi:MAG: amidase [Halodesulfurarchaeum sp.]